MWTRSIFVLIAFGLAGCAGTPPTIAPPVLPPQVHGVSVPGIYHRVQKGQTLWRIAGMYNVDLDEIARINHISDTTAIEVGQQIFIPNRQKPVSVSVAYGGDDFLWPVKGQIIGAYGRVFDNMVNKGLNIEPQGSADVLASRSGKVVFYAEDFGSFGRTVIIDHGDGFSTVYARNGQVYVRAGDNVRRGEAIASVGSSGRDRQAFLHFEIRKSYIPQNPLFYLPRDN